MLSIQNETNSEGIAYLHFELRLVYFLLSIYIGLMICEYDCFFFVPFIFILICNCNCFYFFVLHIGCRSFLFSPPTFLTII